jgi:hypothetical protein
VGVRDDAVAKKGGWTVLIELTGADAQLEPAGRVLVSLDVRATLRTRSGNVYLGQTQLARTELSGGRGRATAAAPAIASKDSGL